MQKESVGEINSEEIEDENGDREDDKENVDSECEEEEESTYGTETGERTLLNHETAKQRNTETITSISLQIWNTGSSYRPRRSHHVCNILEYGLHDACFKAKDFTDFERFAKLQKTGGAFHYAKDSGNFGRNSNGKVNFGFFKPEYSGSPTSGDCPLILVGIF